MRRATNSSSGFTFIELMISAAIGMVLVVSAAKLYTQGLHVAWETSQKAELQSDFRAAANLLQQDISLAGAGALGQQGLSNNAIAMPNGVGSIVAVYPCTALSTCNYINGAPVAYPSYPAGSPPTLYSIIPGPNLGITVTAAQGPTDIITLNYADANLPLNCYIGTMNATGTSVQFQLPAAWAASCVLPSNEITPPSLIYSNTANAAGLQVGDLILFGFSAAGVVTGAASACAPSGTNLSCFNVPFAAGDPGHVNQPGVAAGSLLQLAGQTNLSAVRLISVTYYLTIPPSSINAVTPNGVPTLMRLQSGKLPAPVAENVIYLKFTYDVISGGVVTTNQPSLPAGTNPTMVTKINIAHMSMRSQGRDTQTRSSLSQYGGYEGLDLQTSIAVRNMTMLQQYPIN